MNVLKDILPARQMVLDEQAAGKTVGFVPTMGALHAGHMSLIHRARRECDFVAVSIFVNPTQFGPAEDLSAYPRPLDADLAACRDAGVDIVFNPDVETMYPASARTNLHVEGLGRTLCGAARPGHFDGVCTVVAKLLHIIPADVAYFGAKDYQQVAIVRKMVEDLNFPVRIEMCPIVREADGLAMSSRNAYLSDEQRRQAVALHRALVDAADWISSEHPLADEVRRRVQGFLETQAPGGEVDYVEIVDPDDLTAVDNTDRPVVVAVAVRFGRARLIDNIEVPG